VPAASKPLHGLQAGGLCEHARVLSAFQGISMESPASGNPVKRPPSPCINLCRMDPSTGWCEGCARTIAEITAWSKLSATEREPIWAVLPSRRSTTKIDFHHGQD
jgi:predicted Fe-S protein YdhL (DUF1289 family)